MSAPYQFRVRIGVVDHDDDDDNDDDNDDDDDDADDVADDADDDDDHDDDDAGVRTSFGHQALDLDSLSLKAKMD